MLLKEAILKRVAHHLPGNVRGLARRLYYRNGLWGHPALQKFGTIQDLYYWKSDGNLDTLLLLQNYFSAFYPNLQTETEGSVSLFDQNGQFLAEKGFSLPHCGSARLRVSELLQELPTPPANTFGTLEVKLDIPDAVLSHIQPERALYFWDRFYLGFTNSRGQVCFVHGVDKTHVYREGETQSSDFYPSGPGLSWAPETPIDIEDYEKLSVVMINRTSRASEMTLHIFDVEDKSLSWEATVPPKGVHGFELTRENTAGLVPTELRLRIEGMSTQFGRPLLFKEFANGAISVMHC